MNKKMWSGRFSSEQTASLDAYNRSISFDKRLYEVDILASIAHSQMLSSSGILTSEDQAAIEDGLLGILADLKDEKLSFDMNAEDIHMFIEAELTQRIGEAGKRLHTARSRNDQVATDLKLYLREEAGAIKEHILALIQVCLKIAKANLNSIMPGYTHLQRAQPITLAHHQMAYVHMFLRDIDRLNDWHKRMNTSPLGSGALAGTTYPINRQMTADLLQFREPTRNSLDGVSDRDYVLELSSILAMFMMHLSRLSEEIILFASQEFGFLELSDAYATGSSIMPQKKNPDIAELTRAKAARSIGSMTTLYTMMKALPLAYNKDMQEDKEAIFDSIDTVHLCLPAFTGMLDTASWNTDKMRAACKEGFLGATDLADYLVKKGIAFRDAHEIVGKLVKRCQSEGITLSELRLDQWKAVDKSIDADVYLALDLDQMLMKRSSIGGPAPNTVREDIVMVEQSIKALLL